MPRGVGAQCPNWGMYLCEHSEQSRMADPPSQIASSAVSCGLRSWPPVMRPFRLSSAFVPPTLINSTTEACLFLPCQPDAISPRLNFPVAHFRHICAPLPGLRKRLSTTISPAAEVYSIMDQAAAGMIQSLWDLIPVPGDTSPLVRFVSYVSVRSIRGRGDASSSICELTPVLAVGNRRSHLNTSRSLHHPRYCCLALENLVGFRLGS